MGFPVPVGLWFKNRYKCLIDEYVTGDRSRDRGLFNHNAVDQLIKDHVEGVVDNGTRLWSLLNLEIWFRQSIDGEGVDKTTESIRELIN